MYENKKEPLIPTNQFKKRLYLHVLFALLLVFVALLIGIAGHVYFDDMAIGTALVASITITSGLGLSVLPDTFSGQIFASIYAIFSGYIYIATSSIVIAPILHRVLHKLHMDDQ